MMDKMTRVITVDDHQTALPIFSPTVRDLKSARSSLDGKFRKTIHMKNRIPVIPHQIHGVV